MQTTQGSVLQSLRAVKAFLDTNAEKLAGVVTTGARKRLDQAIDELSGHTSDQTGSFLASQGATQKQRSLRRALLRDHMAPIARIAKADLPFTPEIEPLRMPAGRPTAERLATLAYGMAQAARPHAAVFVDAGLQPDFVLQLTGAADAMLNAIDDRVANRGKRTGATKGIKYKLIAARKIVHILDSFVRTALKDDPPLLGTWNTVKRVSQVTGRPSVAAPASPVSALPAPAPAPALSTPAPTPQPATPSREPASPAPSPSSPELAK
jgi:hypothetical protein